MNLFKCVRNLCKDFLGHIADCRYWAGYNLAAGLVLSRRKHPQQVFHSTQYADGAFRAGMRKALADMMALGLIDYDLRDGGFVDPRWEKQAQDHIGPVQ